MKVFLGLIAVVAVLAGAYFLLVPDALPPEVAELNPFAPAVDAKTGKPLITCPTCEGNGSTKCPVKGCDNGQVECNGPCLRLTGGHWIKDERLGHGPDYLWAEFTTVRGKAYIGQAHVGEIIEIQNGRAVSVGRCKVCRGTTRMPCPICHGSGIVACPTCHGQRKIPDPSAAPSDQPPAPVAANRRADAAPMPVATPTPTPLPPIMEVIRLKNGKVIAGQIVIRDETVTTIRTPDGKSIQVPTKSIEVR